MLKFPAPPKSLNLDSPEVQSLRGDSVDLFGKSSARIRIDIRIHPNLPDGWANDTDDDEFIVEMTAVLLMKLSTGLDGFGNESFEISKEVIYGTSIHLCCDLVNGYPLAHQNAIEAIADEWADFESETRAAIARRKQAYSYL